MTIILWPWSAAVIIGVEPLLFFEFISAPFLCKNFTNFKSPLFAASLKTYWQIVLIFSQSPEIREKCLVDTVYYCQKVPLNFSTYKWLITKESVSYFVCFKWLKTFDTQFYYYERHQRLNFRLRQNRFHILVLTIL